jgi:hypothetical protein
MKLDYPRNVIWYVEARPWSGTPQVPGDAPADPHLAGTAVAVELESFETGSGPGTSSTIKKYLLTCAHVVRQQASNGDRGWGPLLEEICCWQWGQTS